jgi:hypothetical protein
MEKTYLRAVEADQWQTRQDITVSIPDSFDREVMASLPSLPDEPEKAVEWSGMLEMIGNASGVLWQKDAEVESLKTQIEMQKKAMLDECQGLQAELKEARDETQRANAAAALATNRAIKAEAWLQQVKEALASGFAPHLGRAPVERPSALLAR